MILPHVQPADLPAVYAALRQFGLATANLGLISDFIACPGMDYCALATRAVDPDRAADRRPVRGAKLEHEVGPLRLNISGCINACGHHHVGHIGILGLERAVWRPIRITLGGDPTERAAIGERTGPGFSAEEIVGAVERDRLAYHSPEGERGGDVPRRLPPCGHGAVPGRALPQGDRECGLRPNSSRSTGRSRS